MDACCLKEIPAQVFSYEFYEMVSKIFFIENLRVTVSVYKESDRKPGIWKNPFYPHLGTWSSNYKHHI